MAGNASVLEDHSLLSKLDKKLLKIEKFFALVSGLAIFSLMVLAVRSVGGREFFEWPLSGYVDWGYAKDFMNIAKVINESNHNDNFIIGTGKLTKVEEFVNKAFSQVNLNWNDYVTTSDEFKRPVTTGRLCADITKLKTKLNIEPTVDIDELISIMLESDLNLIKSV